MVKENEMRTTDATVMIREHGHGVDQLTSGVLSAHSIDYEDPEGWVGSSVTIRAYDENGNPIERCGELISVEEV